MAQIIYASADCWVTCLHVGPNYRVGYGDKLYDTLSTVGGGIDETVTSNEFGIIKQLEGIGIFADNDNFDRRRILFFKEGDPMFAIDEHEDGADAGTIRGLTPRPTTVIARRRARGLNLI